MLRAKSIYAAAELGDGIRILIMRYYPRGIKKDRFDEWIRELAPSAKLLKEYKNGDMDGDEFSRRFAAEMAAEGSRQAVVDLGIRAAESDITILCYEPEGQLCHRNILLGMINDGITYLSRHSTHF